MIVCVVRKPSWSKRGPYSIVVARNTIIGELLTVAPPLDLANQIWIFETMGM